MILIVKEQESILENYCGLAAVDLGRYFTERILHHSMIPMCKSTFATDVNTGP